MILHGVLCQQRVGSHHRPELQEWYYNPGKVRRSGISTPMRWDWRKGLHGSQKEAYTHPENISGMAYHNTTAVVRNFIGGAQHMAEDPTEGTALSVVPVIVLFTLRRDRQFGRRRDGLRSDAARQL